MKMVIVTSRFRWKTNYQGALCEFGETVLIRTPGKLTNKADTAWYTGIWLGKAMEAEESIVQCEGIVLKVRMVKSVIPSKQWNTELHKSLNSDHKGKDTTDTGFVLPPSMVASSRVRPPPGLETEVPEEQTGETKFEQRMAEEEGISEVVGTAEHRRQIPTTGTWSPKRSNEDELSDEDTREHKRQTVALFSKVPKFTISVISTTILSMQFPPLLWVEMFL